MKLRSKVSIGLLLSILALDVVDYILHRDEPHALNSRIWIWLCLSGAAILLVVRERRGPPRERDS